MHSQEWLSYWRLCGSLRDSDGLKLLGSRLKHECLSY